MTDTPEEAEFRAKTRVRLQKEKDEAERKARLEQIEKEEKARIEAGTLGDRILDFGKSAVKSAVSGWTGKPTKKKKAS